jgi:hypothetical protein
LGNSAGRQLDSKLDGATWIESLGLQTIPWLHDTAASLDLANVTFADREAMLFLCSTKSSNIAVENCPSYAIRWIEQEGLCRRSEHAPTNNPSNS